MIAVYNLGLANSELGQRQQAIEFYQHAFETAQQSDDAVLETYLLNKLEVAQNSLVQANQSSPTLDP